MERSTLRSFCCMHAFKGNKKEKTSINLKSRLLIHLVSRIVREKEQKRGPGCGALPCARPALSTLSAPNECNSTENYPMVPSVQMRRQRPREVTQLVTAEGGLEYGPVGPHQQATCLTLGSALCLSQ